MALPDSAPLFGRGSDGYLNLTDSSDFMTAPRTATVSATSNDITTSESGISAGDLVCMMKMRGNTTTNSGKHEFRRVSSVSSGHVFTDRPFDNTYNDTGANQSVMIKVKEYAGGRIAPSGTWNITAWDGDKNGVGMVFCSGVLTIEVGGRILGTGKGFRGGTGGSGIVEVCDTGDTGESALADRIAGGSSSFGASPSPSVSTNDGAGRGAQGKRGSDQAAGGGGASHATVGTVGQTVNNGSSVSGGSTGSVYGVSDNTDRVLMGAGGGGGGKSKDPNGQGGGNGGNGGAIIYLVVRNLRVLGQILSNGNDGNPGISGKGGGGGAGAGGTIVIICEELYLDTVSALQVLGGTGGVKNGDGGNGGNGGKGRITIYAGKINGQTPSSTYYGELYTVIGLNAAMPFLGKVGLAG